MEAHKEIKYKERNSQKLATIFLIAAFVIMALWGYTPLKNVMPALWVLSLFIIFCLFAVAFTILGVYRGIQARALKAKIEDS